ncbi:hypothetical protein BDR22DRAFT_814553 [Usnea florida]
MLLALHRTAVIVISLSIWPLSVLTLPTTSPLPSRLNITTIGAANGKSTLECWQLSAPLVPSNQPGVVGSAVAQLGEAGATSYTLLPPQYDGGLHNAPAVQWVVFISGLAVISLPNSTETATVVPGSRNGLILATDTQNVSTLGHVTSYPSKEKTAVVLIPVRDNEIPAHTVLHGGSCKRDEMDQ